MDISNLPLWQLAPSGNLIYLNLVKFLDLITYANFSKTFQLILAIFVFEEERTAGALEHTICHDDNAVT